MAVAGVVILYQPEDNVLENVHSYFSVIDKLYVVDNSENQISFVATTLKNEEKVKLIYDGKNQGIAKRLNEAASLAIAEGYNWLLTMDQDSKFNEAILSDYLLCAGSYLYKDNTAMYGVEYERQISNPECTPKEVVQLITSGSIINLNLFNAIGGFDEALFIDEVDLEYCYRAITKGYKIVKFSNIFMTHQLGKVSYHKSLKNLESTPRTLHSPVRLYYMVRNYLYVAKKYKNTFAENDAYRRTALLNRVKNNLLYGKNKMETIRYLIRAWKDSRNGVMGKINS